MPQVYIDPDGEEMELPTPEELEELQKKASSNEELQAKLAEQEEELKKLQEKDHNFKKLRDKTKEDEEKYTEKELELKKEIDSARETVESTTNMLTENWKDKAIRSVVGDDKELAKKIEEAYKLINIEAKTEFEVGDKVAKAARMITGNAIQSNPFQRQYKGVSKAPGGKEKVESEASREQARNLKITDADKKKYDTSKPMEIF